MPLFKIKVCKTEIVKTYSTVEVEAKDAFDAEAAACCLDDEDIRYDPATADRDYQDWTIIDIEEML